MVEFITGPLPLDAATSISMNAVGSSSSGMDFSLISTLLVEPSPHYNQLGYAAEQGWLWREWDVDAARMLFRLIRLL